MNYKDGWFPACFALEKIVRFNKHSSPNRPKCGSLSFCRQVAAICKGIKQWKVVYFTIFWLFKTGKISFCDYISLLCYCSLKIDHDFDTFVDDISLPNGQGIQVLLSKKQHW